jgi:N-dimethylarginine dimethylaminohydrolase
MASKRHAAALELHRIYEDFHPPIKTRFEDEVEKYWGRSWGANTEVGRLRMVMLHRPGEEMKSVQPPLERWRYTEMPNLEEMQRHHENLVKAFRDEDVEVVIRRPENNRPPRLVKSIYTRDPSFAIKGSVVVGRMYDALRRGEELPTMQTLADLGCPVHVVHGAGIIEGGSVMWLDSEHLAIGLSHRVNEEGARQVADIVKTASPEVDVKVTPIMDGHIDGFICMLDKHLAAVAQKGLPYSFREFLRDELKMNIIPIPPGMYAAAVAVRPGRVLVAAAREEEDRKVLRMFEESGVDVVEVELDSLVEPRNSGSIHCLTMPIIRDPEPRS